MKVYVVYEYTETPDYNGKLDEATYVYGSITGAIDAVQTMFRNEKDDLELKDHHIDSYSLFVTCDDGYCRGTINYRSIEMDGYAYTWSISCTEYDVK